ncbi:MAG: hypothetical protein IH933_09135 [Euryarchaeota archaeon]|nr:hypothetical protein [Euryarchaeota archaeon]
MQARLRDDPLLSLTLAFVREMDGERDGTSPVLAPADADAEQIQLRPRTNESERTQADENKRRRRYL